jgi:hypothetical protein
VGCLADGTIVFVGGTTDTQGGSTQVRGIFQGMATTPILVGGDTVPGLPTTVDATGIDFDFRFSAAGTHYISPVSAGGLDYLVVSGVALEVDGVVVGEGNAVPESAGGLPGEAWDNFDFVGVTEEGVVFFTGDTDADIGMDEFVFLDGGIVLREGDVAGSFTVAGAMEGGYLNADGDYAVVWDVEDPEGDLEALIVNGQVVAVEGDPVDLDGDGVAEEGTRIDNFTGISSLTLGDRDTGMIDAYVTIDVEVPLARPVGPTDALAIGEEAGLDPGAEVALAVSRGTQVLEGAFRISVPVENVGVPGVATSVVQGVSVTRNPVPVGDVTTLVVDLSREAELSVDVVGIDGRRVATLGRRGAEPGRTSVRWDHTDALGRPVAAGAYWLVAEADGHRRSVRVTVLD